MSDTPEKQDENSTKNTPKSTRPGQLLLQKMFKSALILSIFTVLGVGLLLGVKLLTDAPIREAEKQTLLNTLNEVLPPAEYDNALLNDTLIVTAPEALGTAQPVTIYRARMQQQPVAVILTAVAPDGYSGNIELMIAVYQDGRVAGVRVLKHKETPGLGDKIETRKSNWILSFNGLQLNDDNLPTWAVRKDGGQFDQFTGATITPRAIIKAVRNALTFVNQKGQALYE